MFDKNIEIMPMSYPTTKVIFPTFCKVIIF